VTHGASAYVYHRCRCEVCTAANTARVRAYRKRRTVVVPTDRLGTTPGTSEKCPRDVGASGGVARKDNASMQFRDYPASSGGAT
jgi:hypothetical protein